MEAGTNAIHDAGIRLCRMHDIGGIGKFRASGDKGKTTLFQIAANEALTKIAAAAGRQNIFQSQRTIADREKGIGMVRKCGMIDRRELVSPIYHNIIIAREFGGRRSGSEKHRAEEKTTEIQ